MREISLEEAKPIWDRFVPEKQVWTDDWEIRAALCKGFGDKPLILYDGKNLFPLQYESGSDYYSLLGGSSCERNYLTFDPAFMKATSEIPENVYLDFLTERFEGCTESACPQFFIDLTRIESIDHYIERFSKKHKKNFRRACERYGDYEFKRHGSLEELAELNKAMFKDQSDFVNETRLCYEILDRDSRTEYWTIMKDGNPVMVGQYFFCGRTMAVCVWGMDRSRDDTLKVAMKESIKLAKSRGCSKIDYAPTYSGWKSLYRLDTLPLWRYKRGDIPRSVDVPPYGIPAQEKAERLNTGFMKSSQYTL